MSDTDEEDRGSDMMEEDLDQGEEESINEDPAPLESRTTATLNAPTLSKSWAVRSSHVPVFTGGKICPLYLKADTGSGQVAIPCLLLPVDGDLAVVDVAKGTKLGSVRESSGGLNRQKNDDDGDDDERIDGEAITAFALSSNQETLVTCSQNHLMQQYSIKLEIVPSISANDDSTTKDRRVSVTLQKNWGRSGHLLPVTDMEFHKSGVFVISASVDGTCRVFDARGGHVTHIYRPMAGGSGGGSGRLSVTCVRWMKDNAQLVVAIGRDDGSIAIHNLRDKDLKRVVVLREHMSAVTSMDWWSNDRSMSETQQPPPSYPTMFVTAARDAVVNLWQIRDSKSLAQVPSKAKGKKKKKPKASEEGTVVYQRVSTSPLYEQVEGLVVMPWQGDKNGRGSITISTAGSNGVVRVWKWTSIGETFALSSVAEQPASHAYGKDRGGYLSLGVMDLPATTRNKANDGSSSSEQHLVVADAEHCISFLSFNEDRQKEELMTARSIVGFNDEILDIKMIPPTTEEAYPNRVVVATNSTQVRIFELDSFSCHVLEGHTATVLCLDVSPCGRYIATCGKDSQMRLWHAQTRKCIATGVGHTEAIGATALSRKKGLYDVGGKAARNGGGAFAVTVSSDKTLKRWNLPGSGELDGQDKEISLVAAFSSRAHEKDINVVSVAPNDSLVATGSQDKCAKLWKSNDLSLVATLRGHRRGVWDCQFSPFDRVVATASGDKSVRLWSLTDFSCVRSFQGHISSVLRVRFLNGGLQLLSSGADGLVKLWTIRTNECEATMDGHSDKVWALDVAPQGRTMISGSADSKLLVWEDTTRATDEAKRAEREEAFLMDQRLANHLRHKEFGQALDISLNMDKPRLTLKVLTSIIEAEIKRNRSPIKSLQQYISTWSIKQVIQVLQYCRDWNTRARNCDVAMTVIRATVSVLPADELGASDSISAVLAGVTPYAERHFDRLDGLLGNAYLLDFALFSMGSLDTGEKDEFAAWEAKSKLVLPSSQVEGRIQVGRQAIVGSRLGGAGQGDSDNDEITIVGDSDSSESDDSDDEDPEMEDKVVPESTDSSSSSSRDAGSVLENHCDSDMMAHIVTNHEPAKVEEAPDDWIE